MRAHAARLNSGFTRSTPGARRRSNSDRERAALEWTEAITRVADTHVPDEVFTRVRVHFDEPQLVALTFAAVVINSFNRLAISFRVPAGTYQPQPVHA